MNKKQILFIIVANVMNIEVANTIFEPLSIGWWVYTALCSCLFVVGGLALRSEK